VTFGLALGAGNAGLTLQAQIKDTTGTNVGAAITTGFVDLTLGNYEWTGSIADGQQGCVTFATSPGGLVKAAAALNPAETENADARTSTVAAAVWTVATRTLTAFAFTVDILQSAADKVWASATRTLTAFAFTVDILQSAADKVWSTAARTLTAFGFSVTVGTNNDKTGYSLANNAVDAAQFTQAAADKVWASAARTLTAFAFTVDILQSAADKVWASAARTLTSFGTLVADMATAVWAAATRTLTSGAPLTAPQTAAAVWDEPRSSHLAAGSFGLGSQIVRDGTAQGGSLTTLRLDAGASTVDNFYNFAIVLLTTGTGAMQANIIQSYTGATRTALMSAAWIVAPDNTTGFIVLPFGQVPGASAPSAAQIWAYATRTLTTAIAAVTPPPLITGNTVTVPRGDTWSLPFTGLGVLTGHAKLWFTVKAHLADPDSAAVVQIEETGGLLRLNGAAASSGNGSLLVTDAITGALTVTVAAPATATVLPRGDYHYDLQALSGTIVRTLTGGVFVVAADVTEAVS
jgi:hypothetical protein